MKSLTLLALASAALAGSVVGSVAAKPKPAPTPAVTPAAPAAPAAPVDADWRTPDPQDVLVIETTKGRIIVELNAQAAPNHVARVRELVRGGLYDGRSFFRVIDNFMDQTGDPLDSGLGGSDKPNLTAEFTFKRGTDTPFAPVAKTGGVEQGIVGSLPVVSQTMDLALLTLDHRVQAYGTYCPGVIGMARADDPDSANSQFYLMRTNARSPDRGTHSLDAKYTAFGRALLGQDVIDAIKTGEPVEAPQDKMLTVKVLADLPEATRPKIRVIDPRGVWFKAELERQRAAAGIDFSVCTVKLAVEVK